MTVVDIVSKLVSATDMGMRLSEAVERLDSLTSTQLFGVIVSLTVFVTFLVLGSANYPEVPEMQVSVISSIQPTKDGPEPRWHIFRWVNILTAAVFFWSVGDFSLHASAYLNDSDSSILLKFLIGWSVLLCYFFGFFGVSFVHEISFDEIKEPLSPE
jgi:hypothetical protein